MLFRLLRPAVARTRAGARRRPASRSASEPLEPRVLLAIMTVKSDADSDKRDAVLTFREAIRLANGELNLNSLTVQERAQLAAGAPGASDSIHFSIPGDGVHTISLRQPLPPLNRPVVIDGYTQPGSRPNTLANGNDADLRVRIRNDNADFLERSVPMSDDQLPMFRSAVFAGLVIRGGDSTVRGLILTGFTHARSASTPIVSAGAIWIDGRSGNQIIGNFIGLNADGSADPNSTGVRITTSNGNTIGGTAPADRNVVSGNSFGGISLFEARANAVVNNYVGTDPAGQRPVANGIAGVSLDSSTDNTIGGAEPARRNIISGNNGNGVWVSGSSNNRVIGNIIGTTYNRIPISNSQHGVSIHDSFDNRVGSSDPLTDNAAANVIARNGETGVFVGVGTGNVIRGNSIFDNKEIGIDLSPQIIANGVTVNDPVPDADPGGNALQNFPILSPVSREAGGTLRVRGKLESTPSTRFLIDLYGNLRPDESGHGEGRYFLTTVVVTTNLQGVAEFDVSVASPGPHLSATATEDRTSNTSEFSPVVEADDPVLEVGSAADTGPGTLRELIGLANATPGPQTIRFNIPGGGQVTINLASELPVITDTLFIDGYSQPGSVRNTNASGAVNAQVMVRVAGGASFNGLAFANTADNSGVSGLALSGFLNGISVNGAEGVTIGGNMIGAATAGSAANGTGVLLQDAPGTLLGTGHPADRNVTSGNSSSNVHIRGPGSVGNRVSSNLIGLNAAGTAAVGTQSGGVFISEGATANVIGGGGGPGTGNVVSGHTRRGVTILSGGNVVSGNFIGTDVTGNVAVPNGGTGSQNGGVVILGAAGNVIGGHAAGDGNLISGNRASGILIAAGSGTPAAGANTQVLGNTIGLNADGTAALGNTGNGVEFSFPTDVVSNRVGGNSADGVRGGGSSAAALTGLRIVGNNIGGDATGGRGIGNGNNGLNLSFVQNLTVTGNLVVDSGRDGITIFSGVEVDMSANEIGTNAAGAADLGNDGAGARWEQVSRSNADRNQFGGNAGGMAVSAGSNDNTISHNLFGLVVRLTPAGAPGGPPGGVDLRNDPLQLIQVMAGGDGDDQINVTPVPNRNHALFVGGNGNDILHNALANSAHPDPNFPASPGVAISGDGNRFWGNIDGALVLHGGGGNDSLIVAAPGHSGSGLIVSGDNNQIGGAEPWQPNLFLGNGYATGPFAGPEAAIFLNEGVANDIFGNIIGPAFPLLPSAALPPGLGNQIGVFVIGGSATTIRANTVVGSRRGGTLVFSPLPDGPAPQALVGVALDAPPVIISGNFIGTSAAGRAGLGNIGPGVYVLGLPGVIIGGAGTGDGNVIAGNTGPGVWVEDDPDPAFRDSAFGPRVEGNFIGVTAQEYPMGNGGPGVRIGTLGAVVGGTATGQANVIARNAGVGVVVDATTVPPPAGAVTVGTTIRGNSIYANGSLGIDLGGDGVTANDSLDADSGANALLNFPQISSVSVSGGQLTVAGTYDGRPGESFTLDFYASASRDPSGFGEGLRHLGSAELTTDAAGRATFSVSLPAPPAGEPHVTATATAFDGATSEFSAGRPLEPPYGAVLARRVFYNRSAADGNDAAAGAADDAAVATDKVALLPGQRASFSNVTAYSRGLNGVMIDLGGLPEGPAPSSDDFVLHVGNGAVWSPAPPATVTVRRGAGAYGSDRVTLVFADAAVRNTWLRVTVLPRTRTALASADVFYFGNLAGDTGGVGTPAVNAADLALTRKSIGKITAAAVDRFDFDRDGRVGATDLLIVRQNQRRTLPLFTAPATAAGTAAASSNVTVPMSVSRRTTRPSRRGVLDAPPQGLLA